MTEYRVMIPIEPDESMIEAGCQASGECERAGMCYGDCKNSDVGKIYKAMVRDYYRRVKTNKTSNTDEGLYRALQDAYDILTSIHQDPDVLNAYKCHYDEDDLKAILRVLSKTSQEAL